MQWSNLIHKQEEKESRRRFPKEVLAVALFVCLMFVSYRASDAIVTSSTYGNRELPIYSVDTKEKKIALREAFLSLSDISSNLSAVSSSREKAFTIF